MTGPESSRRYNDLVGIKPVAQLQAPAFKFEVREQRDTFSDLDARLDEITRRAAAVQAVDNTLVLQQSLLESEKELSVVIPEDGEDLLDDARHNVAIGEYNLALELLSEYIELSPEKCANPEACYLRAFCLFRIGHVDQLEPLRILNPLRSREIAPALNSNVMRLRADLRSRLTPAEVSRFSETTTSDPVRARSRLREYIELVPEEGIPPYVMAMSLIRDKRYEAAYEIAAAGAEAAENERDAISTLARKLTRIMVAEHAATAVALFNREKYRQARDELQRIDARWQRTTLVRDFDAWLTKILVNRGAGEPVLPRDVGFDRVNDLYELVSAPILTEAVRLLGADHAGRAERILAAAVRRTPAFPWLNYLYAVSLFLQGKDLDRAAAAARVARQDRTIADAEELLTAIITRQEGQILNPAIDELISALDTIRDKVDDDRLRAVEKRLHRLQRRLPTLAAAMSTPSGKQVVRDLEAAIDRHLRSIAEILLIGQLYDKYRAVMSQVQGGIAENYQVSQLDSALDGLSREIAVARRKMTMADLRSELDVLEQRIADRRRELRDVEVGLEVSAVVKRFNALADSLSGSYSRSDSYRVLSDARGILKDAQRLQRRATDRRDQQTLQQIVQSVSRLMS